MIVDGAFLVAGCDAALLLEAVDQALDAVALAINGPIKAGVAALIVFCRDDRGDAPAPDPAARGLTGIGFVTRHLEAGAAAAGPVPGGGSPPDRAAAPRRSARGARRRSARRRAVCPGLRHAGAAWSKSL